VATFVPVLGGYLLLFIAFALIAVFDLPGPPVIWSAAALISLGTFVLAITMGMRSRADLEGARRDAGQAPDGDGKT
jgi:hypothetical protein